MFGKISFNYFKSQKQDHLLKMKTVISNHMLINLLATSA